MCGADTDPDEPLLEQLLADYARRSGLDETPRPSDYDGQLPTESLRRRFRALVQTLDDVEQALPVPLTTDTVIAGRYRIVRHLDQGGWGRVVLARDLKNDRDVALKVLKVSGSHATAAATLRRERKALSRLQHPNIVTFLDADRWRGCSYLVMQLVDGANLADVLEQLRQGARGSGWRRSCRALTAAIARPVPGGRSDLLAGRSYDEAVAAIVAACASALECAHLAGVVHRDLKPGNVLVRGGGNPVLLDFGLAGLPEGSHGPHSNELHGTPPYLAPEQARNGRMGTDVRTDLYKLGALLYELLTLQRPWAGLPASEILTAVRDRPLPSARSIDASVPFELDRICARATAAELGARYQHAADLRADLERYLGGRELPVAARAGAPLTLRCRYFARRRAMLLVAVLVLAVAAGLRLLLRP